MRKLYPAKLIKSDTLHEHLGKEIDKRLEHVLCDQTNISITQRYNAITETVYETCTEFLKPPSRKNQYWFDYGDQHIEILLNKRRQARKDHLSKNSNETKAIYQDCKLQVCKYLRMMENKFWKEKCEKMQYYANRGDTHQLYKEIKKSYGPEKSTYITSTFLKKDGTITKSTTESLDRLQQYYSELLNRQPFIETSKIDQYLSQFCRPTNWTLDEEPTFKEFKDTLKAMKNHKTTAVDPIPVEIYKYVTLEKLQSEIHLIILECWNTSIMPETFHDIIICSLFKTGNKQMCENQRGISLISHLCKALSRLGANILSKYCEKEGILPESQSAFRAHRSTNDMVFTTRLLQYSCWEKNVALYLGFIDIAKAYDSIHQSTLWKILATIGIPPKLLAVFQALYSRNNCRVKFGNKFSKKFKVIEGLKQGCPAACILFNIFFAIVIGVIKQQLYTQGIELKFRYDGDIFNLQRLYAKTKIEKKMLLEMLFADDAAVCATTEEELQVILNTFFQVFKQFGLQMAIKKTEVLFQRPKSEPDIPDPVIVVDNNQLRVVEQYKYLGSLIKNNSSINTEISSRCQKAVGSFNKLYQRVWKKKHLKLKTKIQIYRTVVFPTLTYGCETWNWNAKQMRKMEGIQYRFLRTVCGKTWQDKVSYVELLKLTTADARNNNFDWANTSNKGVSITSVETFCRLARLRYAGHVARMAPSRIPKMMLFGEVNVGQRKSGRPLKSFREGLKNDLKAFELWTDYQQDKNLQTFTENRVEWQKKINKKSQKFQKDWEKNRIDKSNSKNQSKQQLITI